MGISLFPQTDPGAKKGQTVTGTNGAYNVDCSAGTDFYLDLNDSYYSQLDQIEYVGGTIAGGTGRTSNYSLSINSLTGGIASAPADGDLIIAVFTSTAANGGPSTDKAYNIDGYTQISKVFVDGNRRINLFVGYKFVIGTETSINFIGGSGNIDDAFSSAAYVFRNVSSTPLDVAVVQNTSPTTAIPTFSSITPVSANSRIVVIGAGGHQAGVQTYTSSGLSSFLTNGGADDVNDATLGIGQFNWSSGAYTPTSWTSAGITAFAGNQSFASVSLALRADYNKNADITFSNIPQSHKSINVFSNALSSSFVSRRISWDSNLIELASATRLLFPGQSFFYEIVAQGGSLFLKNSISSSKVQKTDKVTGTSSWICPPDVTQIDILLCGGGGGGSSTDSVPGAGSVRQETLSVIPGVSYSITIGAGGASGSTGSAGSSSSFGSLLTVPGGAGNAGAPGGVGGYGSSSRSYGIDGYGHGGNSGSAAYIQVPNNGSGGNGASTPQNGSSGVAIIKYWTAT